MAGASRSSSVSSRLPIPWPYAVRRDGEPSDAQDGAIGAGTDGAEDAVPRVAFTARRMGDGVTLALMGSLGGAVGSMPPTHRATEYTEGTAQCLAEENTALNQLVRQLVTDHRALEGRLQAARSNDRFLDQRLANLEAELVEARATGKSAPGLTGV